jgi:hypothetical protein
MSDKTWKQLSKFWTFRLMTIFGAIYFIDGLLIGPTRSGTQTTGHGFRMGFAVVLLGVLVVAAGHDLIDRKEHSPGPVTV